jgi:hypothetical protein
MATQTKKFDNVGEGSVPAAEKAVSSVDSAVGAAIIAGGIGSTVLGIFVVGAEASAGIKSFLNWYNPVGPLSGKTGLAVIAFIVSWIGLHFYMRERSIKLMTSFSIGLGLIVLGLLLTFPPIFTLFAP